MLYRVTFSAHYSHLGAELLNADSFSGVVSEVCHRIGEDIGAIIVDERRFNIRSRQGLVLAFIMKES